MTVFYPKMNYKNFSNHSGQYEIHFVIVKAIKIYLIGVPVNFQIPSGTCL